MSTKSKKYISLLETAKTLFFRHGIRRVTIEEICAESKVSKVTFYKYFKDKNDLIRVIREELTQIDFARLDEINALPLSYPEKVESMTAWRMQFFASMQGDFIKEIIDINSVSEEIKKRYLANIRQAQAEGEIDPTLSPEMIWLVTEKFNEIVKDGNWENYLPDHIQAQAQLRQMYFYGLLKR
jgi:AcrR family transcriptional regulator